MNTALWIVQILLAVHTLMGAMWKFFNSTAAVPSLKAIPPAIWMGISVFEIVCAVGLVFPALYRPLAILTPLSAVGIGVVLLAYCVLHFVSGDGTYGQPVYWLVVAAFCAFVAYGRFVLRPL